MSRLFWGGVIACVVLAGCAATPFSIAQIGLAEMSLSDWVAHDWAVRLAKAALPPEESDREPQDPQPESTPSPKSQVPATRNDRSLPPGDEAAGRMQVRAILARSDFDKPIGKLVGLADARVPRVAGIGESSGITGASETRMTSGGSERFFFAIGGGLFGPRAGAFRVPPGSMGSILTPVQNPATGPGSACQRLGTFGVSHVLCGTRSARSPR